MRETDIGYIIRRLSSKLQTRADAQVAESGLTFAQVHALKTVWDHGGQVTQRQIEKELRVSHPTVVGIIGRLEKSGYVRCHTDPNDRRNKLVEGTELALQHREIHKVQVQQTEDRLTAGFSPEELELLRQFLLRLYHNVE